MIHSIKIEKNQLSFREQARLIAEQIKKDGTKIITLDFSEVTFISRSFLDELLNMIEEFKRRKKSIEIVNLKPELEKFFQQVAKTKAEIRKNLRITV